RRHGPGHLRADPALRPHPVHLLQPGDAGREHPPAERYPPHHPLRAVRPVPLDPPHGSRGAAGTAPTVGRSALFPAADTACTAAALGGQRGALTTLVSRLPPFTGR